MPFRLWIFCLLLLHHPVPVAEPVGMQGFVKPYPVRDAGRSMAAALKPDSKVRPRREVYGATRYGMGYERRFGIWGRQQRRGRH
jgi:hypothetical protein